MRVIQIKKRNSNKTRTIYVPDNDEKKELAHLVGTVQKRALVSCPATVPHGFWNFRSVVTHAREHIGYKFTLSIDIENWFDNVHPRHVAGRLKESIITKVFVDGAARQGLPTSPAVANLAASSLDIAILRALEKNGINAKYTRYADNLDLSFNTFEHWTSIKQIVYNALSSHSWKPAKHKTRLQSSKFGNRVLCGISIGETEIKPSRKLRRKIRAGLHNLNKCQNKDSIYYKKLSRHVNGLIEYSKLKSPKLPSSENPQLQASISEFKTLCKLWGHKLPRIPIPEKVEEWISPNIVITGDPCYMLGMSTFTTGWTSCTKQPSGRYKKAPLAWIYTKGTRIAMVLSDSTSTFGGVTRRNIIARCLLHQIKSPNSNTTCFIMDRLYGNLFDVSVKLEDALLKWGATQRPLMSSNLSGYQVIGYAPANFKPYCDTLLKHLILLKHPRNNTRGKVWKFTVR